MQQEKANRQSEYVTMNLINSLQREQKVIVERMERIKKKTESKNCKDKKANNEILTKIKEIDGRLDDYILKFSEMLSEISSIQSGVVKHVNNIYELIKLTD